MERSWKEKSFSSSYLPTHASVKHPISDYWHCHLASFTCQLSEVLITSTLGSQGPRLQPHTWQDANNCRLALCDLSPEKGSLGFTSEDLHPTRMMNGNSEEQSWRHEALIVTYLCSKCCCLPREADTLLDTTHHLGASERCCSFTTDISTRGSSSPPVM